MHRKRTFCNSSRGESSPTPIHRSFYCTGPFLKHVVSSADCNAHKTCGGPPRNNVLFSSTKKLRQQDSVYYSLHTRAYLILYVLYLLQIIQYTKVLRTSPATLWWKTIRCGYKADSLPPFHFIFRHSSTPNSPDKTSRPNSINTATPARQESVDANVLFERRPRIRYLPRRRLQP